MISLLSRFRTVVLSLVCVSCSCSCGRHVPTDSQEPDAYPLLRVLEVAGRQGIATDGERYYNSGSDALYVYSKAGELLASNERPFAELEKPANHIGDISVYDGELFTGIEWFDDGRGMEIQIAIYDAETLEYKR